MKFFSKIFLSILATTVIVFSIGSYKLINYEFDYLLSREIQDTLEDNNTLDMVINNRMFVNMRPPMTHNSDKFLDNPKLWEGITSSPVVNLKRIIPFRISDSNLNILTEHEWIDLDKDILSSVTNNEKRYEIATVGEKNYIHVASLIKVLNKTFYLENYKDITYLYDNKVNQYKICAYLICFIALISAFISFVISKFLTNPIKHLSQATKKLAEGDLSQRVHIKSKDEIGSLTQDFNVMASKLESTVNEIKESAENKELFVGNFAHELKTPLTSIMGYSDMLRSKNMSHEQIVLCSNYIFQESKRLESLSIKLMDLIVLNNHDFEKKNISVSLLFDNVKSTMDYILRNDNIEFITSYEDAILSFEPELMETVLINIIDNARKSICNGNGKISLVGKSDKKYYSISISDNGIGMEPSEISKITQAFYMVDKSRARKQGGAGLGLSLCAKILELHDGSISFKSKAGYGTTVTVLIPKIVT